MTVGSPKNQDAPCRRLADGLPLGVHRFEVDDGELIFCGYNRAAQRILGIDHAPLLGKKILEAFPHLFGTEAPSRYLRVAIEGGAWSTEQLSYQDATVVGAFECRAFQTEPGQMAVVFEDITLRKQTESALREVQDRLEEQVAQRTAELEQANTELREATERVVQTAKLAAVGELTAGIAHELHQPLNGVKIAAQSLQRDIALNRLDPRELDKNLETVVSLVNRMADIIEHMRIFSRSTRGITPTPIDINAVVDGAFTFLEQQLKSDGVEISKDLTDQHAVVFGDPVALEQVVLNLLSNARYALVTSEKKDLELVVRSTIDNGDVVVEVTDNGTGITDEAKRSVFLPFFTTKEVGQGTGLGLSVSHKIVSEHGGTLTFDSQAGEYTTMTVRLPHHFGSPRES